MGWDAGPTRSAVPLHPERVGLASPGRRPGGVGGRTGRGGRTMTEPPAAPEDPRVRFAAERTLLAWVRTGVALMGFGFVVARFGLFLRELAATSAAARPVRPAGPSTALGVGLTVLGVVVTALAAWEYRAVLGRIDRREAYRPPRVSLGLVMAAVLTALGLATTAYLLTL